MPAERRPFKRRLRLNESPRWGDSTGMRKLGIWIGVLGTTIVTARAARAGEGGATPLMVAAEIEPGVGLEAEDVRRVIAQELHRKVVAPAAAPAVDVQDVLLVSVGRAHTVVSFRASAGQRASRAILTPSDRAGRLRAVAWLAGNLARDQVSPIVLAAVTGPAVEPPTPPKVEPRADVVAPPSPASIAQAPTAPAVQPPAAQVDGDAIELRRAREATVAEEPRWSVSVAGGFAKGVGGVETGYAGTYTWQGEVQRRVGQWLIGGAVDYGPSGEHLLGYAMTGGLTQRWRHLRFEETFGLGIESAASVQTAVTNSSLTGATSSTTVVSPTPAGYARLFVTAAYPLSHSWDAVLRLGAHTNLVGTLDDAFLASSIGVRLRLP